MYGIDDVLLRLHAPASRVHRPTGFFIRQQYQYGIASAKHSNSVTVHMIFNMPSLPMAIWNAAGACAWPSRGLYLPDNTRECATITTDILENAFRYLEGRMQPIPGEDPGLEYAGAVDD